MITKKILIDMLENVPGMLYRVKKESGWIAEFVSSGSLGLTGYQPETFIDSKTFSFRELIHPDDRNRVTKTIDEALSERQPFQMSYRILTAEHREKWVLERGRGVYDSDGKPAALEGFLEDVTDLKIAEEIFFEKRQNLRLLLENMLHGILVHVDCRFVYLNPRAIELFGAQSPDDLMGSLFTYRVNPEFHDQLLKSVGKLTEHRILAEKVVQKWIRLDGSCFDAEISAVSIRWKGVDGILVFFNDVTDRQLIETDLEESNERFRIIVENSHEAIFVTNKRGRFVLVNRAAHQLTGYPDDQLRQMPVWKLFEEGCPDGYRKYLDQIKDGESVLREMTVRAKSGSKIEVELSISGIMLGGSPHMLTTARDISIRKKVEQEKAGLEAQLRHFQKMEAIGTLAGGIAHDFNNIIGAIRTFTELSLLDVEQGLRPVEELRQVVQACHRAENLVDQILTFSRRKNTSLSPIRLDQVIHQSVEILRKTLPKTIRIETNMDSNVHHVLADAQQIEQLLFNLATNARDAMPNGGNITILLRNRLLSPEFFLEIPKVPPGKYVLMEFADTGCGMDEQTIERLYEPFFTTKPVGQGTGLGMASVFGIVQAHHGYMLCQSAPGAGTGFSVFFPALKEFEWTPAVSVVSQTIGLGCGETILVVDDEESFRTTCFRLLTKAGYRVITAGNGKEALEIYSERPETIDLVLLDLNMPVMEGAECMKCIFEIDSKAKVVIMTGYAESSLRNETGEMEAVGFVKKPYARAELLNEIRRILVGRKRKLP